MDHLRFVEQGDGQGVVLASHAQHDEFARRGGRDADQRDQLTELAGFRRAGDLVATHEVDFPPEWRRGMRRDRRTVAADAVSAALHRQRG